MTLEILKQQIEHKEYSGQPVIFITSENNFIPEQYIKKLASDTHKSVRIVDNLDTIISKKSKLFEPENTSSEFINVYITEDFNYTESKLISTPFTFIVTSTIKDSATKEIFKDIIVVVPKLEEWQIKSYLFTQCHGVEDNKLEWLYSICKGDIYRLDQEISKLSCFHEVERKYAFDEFVDNGIFDDLSDCSVFTLVNAIVNKDIRKLCEVYQDIKNIDLNEFGLITLLYSNFKNVIGIQLGVNSTPEKLGLTLKQFNAVKYSCGKYSNAQLKDIFEFITGLDKRIKTGELPTTILVDYIIQKIFSF